MDSVVRFCQDLLPSLEDSVILELKCSGCKELMFHPIFHCERGHSFCSSCYQIGINCKFCGSKYGGNRTHHLERIVDSLTYPCKYLKKGCQKRCHAKKLNLHEEECQTYRFPCPLKAGTKCTFAGTKKQIVFHCQLVHGEFTFVGNTVFKQRIIHPNFLNKVNPLQSPLPQTIQFQGLYLYSFKDVLFQGLVLLEPAGAKVRICRISPPSETDNQHDFLINFYDFSEEIISGFQKRCCISNGWQDMCMTKQSCVQVSSQVLRCCRYFTIEFKETSLNK